MFCPRFKVAICDLEASASSAVSWNMRLWPNVFEDDRQLAEHHRAAGVDARNPFAEPQGFGQLCLPAFGHYVPHPNVSMKKTTYNFRRKSSLVEAPGIAYPPHEIRRNSIFRCTL